MPYYFFIWTQAAIEHLAEHDVSPEEFEEVLMGEHWELTTDRTGRPAARGLTDQGRALFCVFEFLDRGRTTVLPVTAFDQGN